MLVGRGGNEQVVRNRFEERKQEFGLVFAESGLNKRCPSGDVGRLTGRHGSKEGAGGLELGGFLGQWTILCEATGWIYISAHLSRPIGCTTAE